MLFAAHFGFPFSPFSDDKTVFRGGLGIFYDKPEGNIIFGQPGLVPFVQAAQYTNGNLSNITNGAGVTPPISNISAIDTKFKNAYSMQYSFGVQHELPLGVLIELSYVGNQGRHEVREPNINAPSFSAVNAAFAANPALTNITKVQDNPIRPFPGYVDINQYRSDSNSNYNAPPLYPTNPNANFLTTLTYTAPRPLP